MKALAETGAELDTANPTPALIADIVRITDQVPELRVVIDHLPQLEPPADKAGRKMYETQLRELGQRPLVFVKVSEVLRRVNGREIHDLEFYRRRLDQLWDIFGEDRLLYGSDWPNSDLWAPYPQVLRIVQEYFNKKGASIAEKFFWKNSVAAYRWVKRAGNQPQISTA